MPGYYFIIAQYTSTNVNTFNFDVYKYATNTGLGTDTYSLYMVASNKSNIDIIYELNITSDAVQPPPQLNSYPMAS